MIVGFGKVDDVVPLPAVVKLLAHAREGRAIGHGDEHIVLHDLKAALVDLLAAHLAGGNGVIVPRAIAQDDDRGVVELDQFRHAVFENADDGERGIGHLPHLAHGQRAGNGVDTFLDGHAAGQHGGDDLGGQRGKYVGFHAAAQAVGKHEYVLVLLIDDLHAVAAELLADMVERDIAGFRAEIIRHGSSRPLAL